MFGQASPQQAERGCPGAGAVPDESTCVMVEGLSKECCHRCSLSAFGELGEEVWVGVEGRLLVTEHLQLCPHQIS